MMEALQGHSRSGIRHWAEVREIQFEQFLDNRLELSRCASEHGGAGLGCGIG
jgi:hypothetical protein